MSIQTICLRLRSEKIRERKDGRKELTELLDKDRIEECVPLKYGQELIVAAMLYENSEIKHVKANNELAADASSKKTWKCVDTQIAVWVRSLVKHFIASGQKHFQGVWSMRKMYVFKVIVEHTLEVLQDQDNALPEAYRTYHKQLLCDVLDFRVSHSFSLDATVQFSILSYFRECFVVDEKAISESLHQRMLRAFSKTLFSDEENIMAITNIFLEWLCDEDAILRLVRGDDKMGADVVMTLADCCATLLDFHGVGLIEKIYSCSRGLILAVIYHLPKQKSRDTHRDSYLRFLYIFLKVGMQAQVDLHSVFHVNNPLVHTVRADTGAQAPTILQDLRESLFSDEFLRSVVVTGTNATLLKQSRDAFHSPQDEPRLRLYFDVVALVLGLLELHGKSSSISVNGRGSGGQGDTQADSSSDSAEASSPSMMENFLHRISSFDLVSQQAGTGRTSPVPGRGTSGESLTMTASSSLSAAAAASSSSFSAYTQHGTQAFSQGTSRGAAAAARVSGAIPKASALLFEGMLLSLQALVRQFPLGEFLVLCRAPPGVALPLPAGGTGDLSHKLGPAAFRSTRGRVSLLIWLLGSLHDKLTECLGLLSNRQMVGALLNTMTCLAALTRHLLDQGPPPSILLEPLQRQWAQVMHALLQDPRLQPYSQVCKRGSVTECYMTLMLAMLEYDVLAPAQKWSLLHMLWQVSPMSNPRSVESATFLHLLAGMVRAADHDVPDLRLHTRGVAASSAVAEAGAGVTGAADVGTAGGLSNGPLGPEGDPLLLSLTQEDTMHTQADDPASALASGWDGLALRSLQLFESKSNTPASAVSGAAQGVLYVMCWLESQLTAPVNARMGLGSFPDASAALSELISLAIPEAPRQDRYLCIACPSDEDEDGDGSSRSARGSKPKPTLVPDLLVVAEGGSDSTYSSGKARGGGSAGSSAATARAARLRSMGALSMLWPQVPSSDFRSTYCPVGNVPWLSGDLAEGGAGGGAGLSAGDVSVGGTDLAVGGLGGPLLHFLGSNIGAADDKAGRPARGPFEADSDVGWEPQEPLLTPARDAERKVADRHQADASFLSSVNNVGAMLQAVGDLLLDNTAVNTQMTDASDRVTQWQVGGLFLCSSIASLAVDVERKKCGRSLKFCQGKLRDSQLSLAQTFWAVIGAQVGVIQARLHLMRWAASSEFLTHMSSVVKRVNPINAFCTQKRTGVFQACAKERSELCEKLFTLMLTIRDLSIPGLNLDQGGMGVGAGGGGDVGAASSQSLKAAGDESAGKKRPRGSGITFDDDEDFDMGDKGSSKTARARLSSDAKSSSSGGFGDGNNGDLDSDEEFQSLGKGLERKAKEAVEAAPVRAKLTLAGDRQKAFIAAAAIFVIAAFDSNETLLSVFDVIRSRDAGNSAVGAAGGGSSGDSPSRTGGTAASKAMLHRKLTLTVNSDFFLNLAEVMSGITSTNTVYQCLAGPGIPVPWDREWGPLGYYQVLGVVNNLLSRPFFFLCSSSSSSSSDDAQQNPRTMILDHLFSIAAGEKTLRRFTRHYWRIRYMQLQCLSHFIDAKPQVSDEPDCYRIRDGERKKWLWEFFLDRTEDPHAQVRLLAASKLPLLLRYFGHSDKIFSRVAASTPLALLVRAKGDARAIGESTLGDDASKKAYLAVTNVVCLAQLGVCGVQHTLVHRALLAVMTLCQTQCLATGEGNARYTATFHSLLYRTVEAMARSAGYRSSGEFCRQHFRWLLYQWLEYLGLSLSEFPLWLFQSRLPHSEGCHDTCGDGFPCGKQKGYWPEPAALLLSSRDQVLSTIALLRHSSRRIEEMKTFCAMCGYTSSDNDIARFLHHSFPCLKALEVSLANARDFSLSAYKDYDGTEGAAGGAGDSMDVVGGNGNGSGDGTALTDIPESFRFVEEAAESSGSLYAFLQLVSDDVVSQMSSLWVSDIVKEFFVGLTLAPASPGEPMHWTVGDLLAPPPAAIARVFMKHVSLSDMSKVHGAPSPRSQGQPQLPTLQLYLLKGLHEIIGNFVYQVEAQVAEPDYLLPLSKRLQTFFRQHCNWPEILSALHARLCTTRVEKAQVVALVVVEVVFSNFAFIPVEKSRHSRHLRTPDAIPRLVWNGLLDIVVLATRRAASSRVVSEACRVLDVMARRMLVEVYQLELPWSAQDVEATGADPSVDAYFNDVLSDLLLALLSITQALHMCRYRREVYNRHADAIEGEREEEEEEEEKEQRHQEVTGQAGEAVGEEDDWFASSSVPLARHGKDKDKDKDKDKERRGTRTGVETRRSRTVGLEGIREPPHDQYVESLFQELIALSPESDQVCMSLPRERAYCVWRDNIDAALTRVCAVLDAFFRADAQAAVLTVSFRLADALFPLPPSLLSTLSFAGCVPHAESVLFDHQQDLLGASGGGGEGATRRLERRMSSWVALAKTKLQGERCSWLTLWHSLGSLAVMLNLDSSSSSSNSSSSAGADADADAGAGAESVSHSAVRGPGHQLHSVWTRLPELTGRLVSTLASLTPSAQPLLAVQAWRTKAVHMIGHLGAPDLLGLSHHHLPSKEGDTLSLSHSNIPALKAMLVGRLGGLLWDDDPIKQRLASAALRYCANAPEKTQTNASSGASTAQGAAGVFLSQRQNCLTDAELDSIAPKTGKYAATMLAVYTNIALNDSPDTFHALYPPPRSEAAEHGTAAAAGARHTTLWKKGVWKTQGKTYEEWVTALAAAALRSCHPRVAVGTESAYNNSSSSSSSSSSGRGASASGRGGGSGAGVRQHGLSPNYSFLASLVDVCECSAEVAEAVLPMALFEAVKARGAEHNNVASFLTRYVLAPSCTLKLATRLGCAILVFFLRQEVDVFRRRSRSSHLSGAHGRSDGDAVGKGHSRDGGARKESSSKSQKASRDNGGVLLYSYSLNIDLLFAAQAAARCGCVCTSLVFAELAHEHRQTGLFTEGKGGSSATSNHASTSGREAGDEDDRRGESAALLVQIFQQVHDPDALFGMLKEGTSCFSGRAALAIQAEFYAHTGAWMEALSTYESLLQCDETGLAGANGGSGAGRRGRDAAAAAAAGNTAFLSGIGNPQQGVSKALRGLGFQHVLSRYSEASQRSGTMSLEATSENSQLAWKGLDFDVLLSSAASVVDSPRMRMAGTQADSELRHWRTPETVNRAASAMPSPQPDAPFGNRIFSGNTALPGSEHGNTALYFDTTLGTCLKDLARGLPRLALKRATGVANALMSDIGACMGSESAFALVPSIVRAQQLLETCETCELLDFDHNAPSAGTEAAARLARSEVCLSRWHARLAGGSSNNEGSALNEGILSLRISLVTQLLSTGNASACQAILLGRQINDVIPSGGAGNGVVHALSPLAYRLQTAIARVAALGQLDVGSTSRVPTMNQARGTETETEMEMEVERVGEVRPQRTYGGRASSSSSSSSSPVSISKLWQADWALQECKLLWSKGLDKVALRSLDDHVIAVLRSALGRWPTGAAGEYVAGGRGAYRSYNQSYVSNLLSESLRLGGEWLGEKKAAVGGDILTDYLSGALDSARGSEERLRAELSYANFNDQLYHAILARMTSPEHRYLEKVMRDRKQEYDRSYAIYQGWTHRDRNDSSLKEEYKSLSRHLNSLKKEVEGDRKAQEEGRESLRTYLRHALGAYKRVLALSEGEDLEVVFKVVSLWVNEKDDRSVNDEMQAIIRGTKSFKFVPLSYQMISLLGSPPDGAVSEGASSFGGASAGGTGTGASFDYGGSSSSSQSLSSEERAEQERRFQDILTELVYNMCKEHPFHVLPQLFALVNKDEVGAGSLATFRAKLDTSRYEVADTILRDLKDPRKVGASLAHIVQDTGVLLRSYVSLAMVKVDDYVDDPRSAIPFAQIPGLGVTSKNKLGVPFDRCLEAMSGRPAVVTLTPRLQRHGWYRHEDYNLLDTAEPAPSASYVESPVIFMQRIENEFNITESGISVPKVIKVEGSDGVTYKQLVKGNDDMRQDAVMEQVFAHVNDTLAQNEETRKRRLRIRTYKCVPCTPQTGVIEWVEGCRPLGDFLLNKETGLHVRYYPHDWTPSQCRQHMNAVKDAQPREKEQALREVYKHFHPAFRFRFIEQYPDPAQWLSCRLSYTRSVAVNSMVGYILAIGDRHSNNILVDQTSSEVVHIDFGIVFDQGKLLPTPETVPFRLTRDVIDGMGITGVEGTFRRSCEQVLRVIRQNAGQVLTICEVVVHDPLYKWSLSPLEARKKQEEGKDKGKGKRGSGRGDKAAGGASSRLDTLAPSDANATSHVGRTSGGRQVSDLGAGNAAPADGAGAGGNGNGSAVAGVGEGGIGGHQAHKDAAQRMLMTLKSKLQGYEHPAGEALGVDGHVEALIASATDVRNLSKLFSGWAAWV